MYATSQDPNLTAKQVRNVEHQNLQMKVPSTSIKQCCTTGLNHKAPCKTCLQSQVSTVGQAGRVHIQPPLLPHSEAEWAFSADSEANVPLLFMQENVPSNGDSARDNPCSGEHSTEGLPSRIGTCHSAPTFNASEWAVDGWFCSVCQNW
jgi:hypothetical protein